MHMADALLSPAVGATFWAGTAGAIGYCSRRLKSGMDERLVPLMGVTGAFVFASQMINFTIPATGSSGHLGGGLLLAVLLGPHAGFLVIAAVLSVQALFFADGGILALGANIWNLGVYPCLVAYPLIYRPLSGNRPSAGKVTSAAIIAAAVGLQLGALSVVLQTIFSGRSELSFSSFLLLMQPIHLAIGVVEGAATAGVINFVRRQKPEILARTAVGAASFDAPYRRVLACFFVLALLAGGVGAWFSSINPDGLEWSLEKLAGTQGPSGRGGLVLGIAGKVREMTSFLPDYGLKDGASDAQTDHVGTTVSGLTGSLLVLVLVYVLGTALRRHGRKSATKNTHGH